MSQDTLTWHLIQVNANLLLSFQVGTVSISADPRHLTEEIFIIYLINNSSCTTLTLSDLKMTAFPSFSAATLGRDTQTLRKTQTQWTCQPSPLYTATNIQNSFHSHQHTHTKDITFPQELKMYQSKFQFFPPLNCFCLTLSFCSCTSFSLLFSALQSPRCPVPLSSISTPV